MLTPQEVLAISKAYTNVTVEGAGAIKGAPCTIYSIEDIEGGHRVTFKWTTNSGHEETSTMDVMDGEPGPAGRGIKLVQQKEGESSIVIYYTDGTHSDPIVIPTVKGDPGFSPEITVETSTTSTYQLRIKTEDDEFITPNLKGGGGIDVSEQDETLIFTDA